MCILYNPDVKEMSVSWYLPSHTHCRVQVVLQQLLSHVPTDSYKRWQDAAGAPGDSCGSGWLVAPRYNPPHGSEYSDRQLGLFLWRRRGEWHCKHLPVLHGAGGLGRALWFGQCQYRPVQTHLMALLLLYGYFWWAFFLEWEKGIQSWVWENFLPKI